MRYFRRLSALRENFNAEKLAFLKFDIPIMALTATATTRVRDDILKSLQMSEDPKIVLTSFFRPNLRFSVSSLSFLGFCLICLFLLKEICLRIILIGNLLSVSFMQDTCKSVLPC